MSKSLIEMLPDVISHGKREVEKISQCVKISLETNEYILPAEKNDKNTNWFNRLIHGDNLFAMRALLNGDSDTGLPSLRGKIDLIYIDPPFDSKADYQRKITLPDGDVETITLKQFAYSDIWVDGTIGYLKMLYPRLVLMKELLSERGSIYVHCDWHAGHYLKIILDDIFGKENFVNEIVWSYKSGGVSKNTFARKHDTIFFYKKNPDKAIFNVLKEKSYNRGLKPYRFKGVEEFEDDFGWYTLVNCKDVWDIDMVGRSSGERVDYATQKPEKLLERIIMASTYSDSIVADFFGGSGTTAVVAEKLGRRWITSDVGWPSCVIMRKRLIDIPECRPFICNSINKDCSLDRMPQICDNNSFPKLAVKKPTVTRAYDDTHETLNIELDNYLLPDNLLLDTKSNTVVQKIMKKSPLDMVEYWSVDPDYNGQNFRSIWQNYRGNTRKGKNLLRVIHDAHIVVQKTHRPRKICIKAIDIFGFESMTVLDLP